MAEHAAVFVDVETPITVRTNTAEKITVQNDVIWVFGSMIRRLWADGGVDVQSIWRFSQASLKTSTQFQQQPESSVLVMDGPGSLIYCFDLITRRASFAHNVT